MSSGIEIPIENVWGHVNLRAWVSIYLLSYSIFLVLINTVFRVTKKDKTTRTSEQNFLTFFLAKSIRKSPKTLIEDK